MYFPIKQKRRLYSRRQGDYPFYFYLYDAPRRNIAVGKKGGAEHLQKFNILNLIILLIISTALFTVSCPKPANISKIKQKQEDRLAIQRYIIGVSNENRSIESVVMGQGEDAILIMASVHGDETAGTALAFQLLEYLRKYPIILEGRKLMILPTVNPDGSVRNTRCNSRGVDLNRNFSTGNRVNSKENGLFPLSEPETRALVRAIRQCSPNRIVTVHQPLACIDYDGPGKDLAEHIAKYCDLPVRRLGAMPGSLGSYAGLTLNIPTVTLELPEEADADAECLWEQYGAGLIAAILYPQPADFSIHGPAAARAGKRSPSASGCFGYCQ